MANQIVITFVILVLIIAGLAFFLFFWPELRLKRIIGEPFSPRWRLILRKQLPIYLRMPPDLQLQLRNLIKQFIADKRFVGCAGQTITDEIRVTIAAHACLLLLNRRTDCYPQLRSVLVYPSTFVARRQVTGAGGVVSERSHAMLGESWSTGIVVLAWDDVRRSVADFSDGHNVVLHEFAHQLDHEDGADNGAPLLATRGAYQSWSKVLAEEFAALQHQVWQQQTQVDQASLLDTYGATNPAEFFAVATETFFERAAEMQSRHPQLYEELRGFYRVNPADWQI